MTTEMMMTMNGNDGGGGSSSGQVQLEILTLRKELSATRYKLGIARDALKNNGKTSSATTTTTTSSMLSLHKEQEVMLHQQQKEIERLKHKLETERTAHDTLRRAMEIQQQQGERKKNDNDEDGEEKKRQKMSSNSNNSNNSSEDSILLIELENSQRRFELAKQESTMQAQLIETLRRELETEKSAVTTLRREMAEEQHRATEEIAKLTRIHQQQLQQQQQSSSSSSSSLGKSPDRALQLARQENAVLTARAEAAEERAAELSRSRRELETQIQRLLRELEASKDEKISPAVISVAGVYSSPMRTSLRGGNGSSGNNGGSNSDALERAFARIAELQRDNDTLMSQAKVTAEQHQRMLREAQAAYNDSLGFIKSEQLRSANAENEAEDLKTQVFSHRKEMENLRDDYQRQLEDLKDLLETSRLEAERSRKEANSARQDAERARREKDDIWRSSQQQFEDKVRAAEDKVLDFQKNALESARRAEGLQAEVDFLAPRLREVERQLVVLRDENHQLQETVASVRGANEGEIRRLSRLAAELNDERHNLSALVDRLTDQTRNEFRDAWDHLQGLIASAAETQRKFEEEAGAAADLRRRLSSTERDRASLEVTVDNLRSQIQRNGEELETAVRNSRARATEEATRANSLAAQVSELEMQLQKANSKISVMRSETESMHSELAAAESRLETAEAEHRRAISALRRELDTSLAANITVNRDLKQSESKVTELRSELLDVQTELESIRVSSVDTSDRLAASSRELSALNGALEREKRLRQMKESEFSSTVEEIADLKKQIDAHRATADAAKSEVDALNEDLRALARRKDSESATLRGEIQTLEIRITELEDQLRAERTRAHEARGAQRAAEQQLLSSQSVQESSIAQLSASVRSLEDQLATAKASQSLLRSQLQDRNARCEELETKVATLNAELRARNRFLTDAEARTQELQARIGTLQTEQYRSLEDKSLLQMKERELAKERELSKQVVDLRIALAEAEGHAASLQAEVSELRRGTERREDRYSLERDDFVQREQELTERLEAEQSVAAELRGRLARLESAYETLQQQQQQGINSVAVPPPPPVNNNNSTIAAIASLNEQLARERQLKDELQQKVTEMEKNSVKMMKDMKRQVERAEGAAEAAEARARMIQQQQQQQQQPSNNNNFANPNAEMAVAAAVAAANATSSARIAQLEQQLEAARQQMQNMEMQNIHNDPRLDRLEQEVEKLVLERSDLEASLIASQSRCGELENESEQRERTLQQQKQECEQLRGEIAKLKQQLATQQQQQQQQQQHQEENDRLPRPSSMALIQSEEALRKSKSDNQKLEQEIAQLTREKDQLAMQCRDLERKFADATANVARSEQQNAALQRNLEEAKLASSRQMVAPSPSPSAAAGESNDERLKRMSEALRLERDVAMDLNRQLERAGVKLAFAGEAAIRANRLLKFHGIAPNNGGGGFSGARTPTSQPQTPPLGSPRESMRGGGLGVFASLQMLPPAVAAAASLNSGGGGTVSINAAANAAAAAGATPRLMDSSDLFPPPPQVPPQRDEIPQGSREMFKSPPRPTSPDRTPPRSRTPSPPPPEIHQQQEYQELAPAPAAGTPTKGAKIIPASASSPPQQHPQQSPAMSPVLLPQASSPLPPQQQPQQQRSATSSPAPAAATSPHQQQILSSPVHSPPPPAAASPARSPPPSAQSIPAAVTTEYALEASPQGGRILDSTINTSSATSSPPATTAATTTPAVSPPQMGAGVSSPTQQEDVKDNGIDGIKVRVAQRGWVGVRKYSEVWKVMCNNCHLMFTVAVNVCRDPDCAGRIVRMCHIHGVLYQTIIDAMTWEIPTMVAQGAASLFRGQSGVTRLWGATTRNLSGGWLRMVIGPVIGKVIRSGGESLEIDVERNKNLTEEMIARNLEAIRMLADETMENLAKGGFLLPRTMKRILMALHSMVLGRFKREQDAVNAVCTLAVLRFVCPALTNPQEYGVIADALTPEATRSLTLVAKVVQCAANEGMKFSPSMSQLNPQLPKYRECMRQYIQGVTSLAAKEEKPLDVKFDDKDMQGVVRCLHANLHHAEAMLLKLLPMKPAAEASLEAISEAFAPLEVTGEFSAPNSPPPKQQQQSSSTPIAAAPVIPTVASSVSSASTSAAQRAPSVASSTSAGGGGGAAAAGAAPEAKTPPPPGAFSPGPTANRNAIILRGYLEKQRRSQRIMQIWDRRYFVLTKGVLSYFTDEENCVRGQSPTSISLAGGRVEAASDKGRYVIHLFLFDGTTNTRSQLTLGTSSKSERDQWMRALSQSV